MILIPQSLSAQDCPDTCYYYLPNVLTPDCDGIDCEFLEIESNCRFESIDFTIYNRWGEVIFHSVEPTFNFDSSGQQDGTYTWKLKGEFCNHQLIDDTGYLNIIL